MYKRQLLSKGEKLRAIYHTRPIALHHPNLEVLQCDLLDVVRLEEVLDGVTHVYHCAGLVSFSKRDYAKLFTINVEATANLVNAAIAAGVQKFVHVSSVAALGRIREQAPITEKMNWTCLLYTSRCV